MLALCHSETSSGTLFLSDNLWLLPQALHAGQCQIREKARCYWSFLL